MHTYFLEGLGTFALSAVVALSIGGTFAVPVPVVAALTLGLFVYTIGHATGAHLNPAVTIGLWSLGKIEAQVATGYVIAQFLGAAAAFFLANMFVPGLAGFDMPAGQLSIAFAEALGMFFFAFGIASVVYGKVPSEMSGIVVGGSLLLGITLAFGAGSSGILNPAVALALNSFNIMYLLGPIVGSIMGMWTYKLFLTHTR